MVLPFFFASPFRLSPTAPSCCSFCLFFLVPLPPLFLRRALPRLLYPRCLRTNPSENAQLCSFQIQASFSDQSPPSPFVSSFLPLGRHLPLVPFCPPLSAKSLFFPPSFCLGDTREVPNPGLPFAVSSGRFNSSGFF